MQPATSQRAVRDIAERLGDPGGKQLYAQLIERAGEGPVREAVDAALACHQDVLPKRALFLLLLGASLSKE